MLFVFLTLQYKRMNYSYSATLQYALQLGNMLDAVSRMVVKYINFYG